MMASKPKKAAAPEAEKFPRKGVPCRVGATEEESGRNAAVLATSPDLAAFRVINETERKTAIGKMLDVPTLMATLRDQGAAVNRGDLSQAEAMLMNQATALQSLFARLVERGINQEYLPQYEAHMRLALRAQSQCRVTLETLAAIKNPPVLFAKQANIANGPQQVNNGTAISSRAGENGTPQNKLLEASNAQEQVRLDTRAAQAAGRLDPEMATLEPVHRPQECGGQGGRGRKRI